MAAKLKIEKMGDEIIPLEMHFFVDTAFGYSNNQREATLLQNVK
jgi:hypothetical protein